MGAAELAVSRNRQDIRLSGRGQPTLAVQLQRAGSLASAARAWGDVVYVHGATFGANLSIFYRFDGRSWADALNEIGLAAWGFDFPGYGRSERYPADHDRPAGRIGDAVAQLRRVVDAVRARNGDRPVCLVAHSWGGAVAARYAGTYPQDVKALVLFAPIVARASRAAPASQAALPPYVPVTLWAQYRRFVEDVPRGAPQVLAESHFEAWGAAWLASDPLAQTRVPPSVAVPSGPLADIGALWSGEELYDPSLVVSPTLLARGE